jgi:hypothetical protein
VETESVPISVPEPKPLALPPPPEAANPPVVEAPSDWIDCRAPQAQRQSTCQPTEEQVLYFLSLEKTNLTVADVMADEELKNIVCQLFSSPLRR